MAGSASEMALPVERQARQGQIIHFVNGLDFTPLEGLLSGGRGSGDKAEDWALIPVQTLYSIHPSIHLPSLYPSIFHPSVMPTSPFIKSPTDPSIHLSTLPPSIPTFVLIHLPIHPSIHPPTHLPIHVLTHPSTPTHTPTHLPIHPPSHPYVHPSTHSLVIISAFFLHVLPSAFHSHLSCSPPCLPNCPDISPHLHSPIKVANYVPTRRRFPFLLPSPDPSSHRAFPERFLLHRSQVSSSIPRWVKGCRGDGLHLIKLSEQLCL